ncbi:translesion DNA synthesis-associated protein ImuA [Rheinheimera hassiensis]|uniref:translesion DNA synthesis-associated protein ImuA n=1 Tax=Rheinheimera hassiensis TaxID=1193627 RepID=UPI001F060508|nr:translesion DNA synthesis-associated protein ImuA [Rheinheimera hassiensis]
MSALLEQLARRQLVWQGNNQHAAYQPVASGYAELDQQLAGGFPATGLIDIQTDTGIGELRLLLPYLQQQQSAGRLLVLISPLAEPCADMLCAAGIVLSQVVIIAPKTSKDALWAAEQCLQSGSCASVLLWQAPLKLAQARRLQLAAEQGAASLILLRRPQEGLSLPVNLSIKLQAHRQGVLLSVQKRKGGWPAAPFLVDMQNRWPGLCFSADQHWQARRKAS